MTGTRRVTALLVVLGSLAVLPASASASRNVYVTSNGDDKVGTFVADVATGALSPATAATTSTGGSPQEVVLTPNGKFVYVADSGGGISGYAVGADGALTALAGSPFPSGASPYGLTSTVDGKFLYAPNEGSNTINGYAIGNDGALTALAGSPFPGQPGNLGVASSPDGKLLYATGAPGTIHGYSIGTDGALTALPAAPASAGVNPGQPVFTPDGKFLYVSDQPSNKVFAFSVASGGALTPVGGSPFSTGSGPSGSLAMAPDGKHLFVPDNTGGTITAFTVSADGSLGPVAGSPFAAGTLPSGAAVSPNGDFLYSSNLSSAPNVHAFGIDGAGVLSPLTGSPYSSGGSAPDFGSVAVSPDQSPKADFKVIPKSPGIKERTTFNGETSTDSDGTVASYVWDFGDGKTKSDTDARVGHKYKKAGTYTATLTVTDNEGCSTAPVYTGQTASCSGSAKSVETATVEVVDNTVDKPKIKARAKQKQSGKHIVVEVKAGAKEHVEVVGTGTVKIKGKGGEMALTKVKKSVRAGGEKTLKLKLKRESANFKVFRAIDEKRPVKAKVSMQLTDDAGNSIKPKLAILLK